MRGAYGIDQFLAKGIDGRGATVAIVDAYASPTIFADTQKYFARNDPSHPFRAYQFSQSLPASYQYVDPRRMRRRRLVRGGDAGRASGARDGAGGGTTQLFKQPAYQRGVVPADIANWVPDGTAPNGPHRAVPDVAMDADPPTGMLIGQSQTFPGGSIKYSEFRIGGTSLASPLLAGVVAVGDQATGGSLGFLNRRLYR